MGRRGREEEEERARAKDRPETSRDDSRERKDGRRKKWIKRKIS